MVDQVIIRKSNFLRPFWGGGIPIPNQIDGLVFQFGFFHRPFNGLEITFDAIKFKYCFGQVDIKAFQLPIFFSEAHGHEGIIQADDDFFILFDPRPGVTGSPPCTTASADRDHSHGCDEKEFQPTLHERSPPSFFTVKVVSATS